MWNTEISECIEVELQKDLEIFIKEILIEFAIFIVH